MSTAAGRLGGPEEDTAAGPRQPVMADVAALAGVSHQTVSRVLNDHPNVRSATRDRVLSAIRELGYRPNSAARALVTRRSKTLGVVSFDSTLFGPSSMLYGIERAARAAGYYISIVSPLALDARSVQEAVDRLRDQGVEGVVLIAPQTSAADPLAHISVSVPVVRLGTSGQGRVPTVAVDNVAGARMATRFLLDLGHRTVHHISGPPRWLEARHRAESWSATLAEAGVAAPRPLPGDWSSRSGYEAGRRLAVDRDVTAVFCANDHMALGLLWALHEAGRRVPEDISVVGFDDIPEASYLVPPLTTVSQDFGGLGRRGLELLVAQLDDAPVDRSGAPSSVLVAPELVVRLSTAAAPGRGQA
ncbi:LacI family DNA-binding transcriptional regulator [Kitasatospora sp. McL0602]|uniref:LacI family DNA-binding transcriptional regulator n=1 Tax=Kitasatospora sp. McL0602 TaxID=3439530 RepID=UPI003F8AE156